MTSSERLFRAGTTAALLVMALTAPMTSRAQPPDADTDDAPATTQAETLETDISPDAPETDEVAETSPFDYRSSEQISEDLSVSFPVDI